MIALVYPRNSDGEVDGARWIKLRSAKTFKVHDQQRKHRARINTLKYFVFCIQRCNKKEIEFPFYP